jgi:hypothetical protein
MSVDEGAILATVLYDRDAYDAVVDHVDPEEMSAHGGALWAEIVAYYTTDPEAKRVSKKVLFDRLSRAMPKQADTFATLLREFTKGRGGKNITKEVLELKRRAVGDRLTIALSGGADPDIMGPLLAEYEAVNSAAGLLDAGGGTFFDTGLSELIQSTEDEGSRILLLPKALNEYFRGGLLPGHSVVVFGRVNVGKSTFALNAAAGFVRQGARVLYIENEDLLEDTAIRFGCRLVGKDRDWAYAHPAQYQDVAGERGYERFLLPDPAPETVPAIDRMLAATEPDVCIVNQARNLVNGTHNVVAQLDEIAKGIRNIGKRRRIITVQITAAREGMEDYSGDVKDKAILEKHDVYSSRTGFPAAADVMIGYGTNRMLEDRNMAALSVCKNKLGAHPRTGKPHGVVYVTADYAKGILKATDGEG